MGYEIDKFNTNDETKLLSLVMRDFEKSRNWREPKIQAMLDNLSYYHGKHLESDLVKRKKKNNIFIRLLFQIIQTIMPRIMGSQFSGDTLVSARPREKFDVALKEKIEKLIKFEFDNIPNLYLKAYYIFHNMLLYGTGVAKVFWNKARKGLGFDFVHLGDIFPDPTSTGIYNSMFLIHRIETTFKHLLNNEQRVDENGDIVGNYINLDKVKNTSYPTNEDNFNVQADSILNVEYENFENIEKVELLEYWTPEWTITVANRQIIIRHVRNIYKEFPFLIVYDNPEPNSWYAIGEGDLLMDIQKEYNKRINQDLDNWDFQLQPVFALRTGSVKVRDVLTMYDKKVIPVAGSEDINKLIQRWSPGVQPGLGQQVIDRIKFDAQAVTGIPDFTDPDGPAGKNKTATGTSIIAESASQRINEKIDIINYMFSVELGRKILKYFHLFMDAEKVIRITNESDLKPFEEFKIQREDLNYWQTFDLIPISVKEQVDKRAHQERMTLLLQALQGLINDPGVTQKLTEEGMNLQITPLIKDVLKAHGLLNIDDILVVRQNETQQDMQGDSEGDTQAANPAVFPSAEDIQTLEEGAQPPPELPMLNKQLLAQEMLNG